MITYYGKMKSNIEYLNIFKIQNDLLSKLEKKLLSIDDDNIKEIMSIQSKIFNSQNVLIKSIINIDDDVNNTIEYSSSDEEIVINDDDIDNTNNIMDININNIEQHGNEVPGDNTEQDNEQDTEKDNQDTEKDNDLDDDVHNDSVISNDEDEDEDNEDDEDEEDNIDDNEEDIDEDENIDINEDNEDKDNEEEDEDNEDDENNKDDEENEINMKELLNSFNKEQLQKICKNNSAKWYKDKDKCINNLLKKNNLKL